MDFAFTEEHEELRQAVRRFLENESSEAAVRAAMETDRGWDTRVWERMASEVALPGLAVPERHGGAGLGPVELAIVMEEMGRRRCLQCWKSWHRCIDTRHVQNSSRWRKRPPAACAIATVPITRERATLQSSTGY